MRHNSFYEIFGPQYNGASVRFNITLKFIDSKVKKKKKNSKHHECSSVFHPVFTEVKIGILLPNRHLCVTNRICDLIITDTRRNYNVKLYYSTLPFKVLNFLVNDDKHTHTHTSN